MDLVDVNASVSNCVILRVPLQHRSLTEQKFDRASTINDTGSGR